MRLVGVALCLVACGDSAPSGPHVRFEIPSSGLPAPLAVPFPSDIYLDGDGTVVDTLTDWSLAKITNPDPVAAIANAYAPLDGFGRQSGAIFALDGIAPADAVDPATLPNDPAAGGDPSSNIVILDLETGALVPSTAGWDNYTKSVAVMPEDVLAAGHRYAAVITSGVHLTTGAPLAASSGFAAIRDGTSHTRQADAVYGPAIDAAVAAGIARSHIVGATSWTTMTSHKKLRPIRDALVAGTYGAAPTLLTTTVAAPYHYVRFGTTTHAGWTATLDEWLGTPAKDAGGNDLPGLPSAPDASTVGIPHDAIGALVTGAYVSPDFRRPFTGTADLADGTIAFDASGNAVVANATAQVPVTIVVPKGPAPVAGFPVIIYQHGLGGERSAALALANEFARAGIATVAIDAPHHGLRANNAGDSASNGTGTFTGPDGFADGDNPLAILEMHAQLRNFIAAEDNYWQAVLDLVQVRRLITGIDLSAIAVEYGGTAPTLDDSHVGLFGWSMGGAISTVFAGSVPRSSVDPIVLQAPGTSLAKSVADSPVYNAQVTLLAAAFEVPEPAFEAGAYSTAIQLLQGGFDRTEPASFAGDSDHNLWLIRASDDESVPWRWSNTLARAYGASQLTPALAAVAGMPQVGSTLAGSHVVGFFETGPGGHGFLAERYTKINYVPPYPRAGDERFVNVPKPFIIRQPIVGASRAVIHFFESTWAGAPEIKVDDPTFLGLIPVADLDDDGYCDATDTDPLDPAVHPSGAPDCPRDVGF